MNTTEREQDIEQIKNLMTTQGSHGNWDYDPYMMGMYNGMECALACLEQREPEYKSAPEVWGRDKADQLLSAMKENPTVNKVTESSADLYKAIYQ